jgi:hypothetical protein
MMENITKQIKSILSALKVTYSQQGQIGSIVIPALFLFVICCLCSVTINLLQSRNAPGVTPSPSIFPTQGTGPTPTALFNFGGATFTPFPTFPGPTPFPTFTSSPTGSPTVTQIVPTETLTPVPPIPTETRTLIPTNTNPPPAATATSGGSVQIIAVDKPTEYVDIQNLSAVEVNLRGWRLVSETGNQSCTLRGTLQPNEVLRIWARRGNPGHDCGFPINIWNDNTSDPAVLYNPQGEEVSRFP